MHGPGWGGGHRAVWNRVPWLLGLECVPTSRSDFSSFIVYLTQKKSKLWLCPRDWGAQGTDQQMGHSDKSGHIY